MKTKDISIYKAGKLFNVTPLPKIGGVFTVEINDAILDMVGGDDEKKFESYLRKSFRHFYNLDKKLKARRGKGRLKINTL